MPALLFVFSPCGGACARVRQGTRCVCAEVLSPDHQRWAGMLIPGTAACRLPGTDQDTSR